MDASEPDAQRQSRLDRLRKVLERARMRTAADREILRALEESEHVGAKRERENCATWLESLQCGDDGLDLMLRHLARAVRERGVAPDP